MNVDKKSKFRLYHNIISSRFNYDTVLMLANNTVECLWMVWECGENLARLIIKTMECLLDDTDR